ncbi:MAG: RNA polymerase sigma factor [Microthrixaceae bacterium]
MRSLAGRRTEWRGVAETDLVDAARRAPDAFAELYRRHVQRVHAFAYRRARHRETAEDVTAATFEKAWKRLDAFDPSRGQFVNWVLGIAANELSDRARRDGRARRDRTVAATISISLHEPTDPAEQIRDDAAAAALAAAMDALPSRYQQVLGLRHLEGLTPAEVSAALDLSPSVLAVTTHRARKALQRELDRTMASAEEQP